MSWHLVQVQVQVGIPMLNVPASVTRNLSEAVSTLPQSKPIAVVADFCPCCDKAIGGSKMMVCSAGDFNAYNFAGNGLHVRICTVCLM